MNPSRRGSSEGEQLARSSPPPGDTASVLDRGGCLGGGVLDAAALAGLRELDADGGPGFVAEVVATFVEDANNRVRGMQRAVTIGDIEALRRDAHSLKGSSASVAANAVAALCGEIERVASMPDWSEVPILVGRAAVEVAEACTALQHLFPGVGARQEEA